MFERSRLPESPPPGVFLGILAISLICGGATLLTTQEVLRKDSSQLPGVTFCYEYHIQKGNTIYWMLNPESPLYTDSDHYDYRVIDPLTDLDGDPGKWRDTFWNQAHTLPIGGVLQVGPEGWADNPPPDPLDCLLQPNH